MRANIFIIYLIVAVLAFAFFASPSLAKTGTIDLVQGQTTYADGEPLPGANVTIVDGNNNSVAVVVSDSTGGFSFRNVSDGGTGRIRVLVNYSENGTTYNTREVNATWYPSNRSTIDVRPSDTTLIIYRSVQTGASSLPFTVLGQVTDARDESLAGATVILYDGIYRVIGTTTTDQGGMFGFTNVVASSPGCKVKVNYTAPDGQNYENLSLWYQTDSGIVRINSQDTKLNQYPKLGNTGYIWGSILDAAGNPLSGTVYLANETANLSIPTYESANSSPGFISEVPAGNYTAYAEHVDANGSLKSKPLSIDVIPTLKYLDTNAVIFVADQVTISSTATPTAAPSTSQPAPFVNPALIIMALVGAVFAIGMIDILKPKK